MIPGSAEMAARFMGWILTLSCAATLARIRSTFKPMTSTSRALWGRRSNRLLVALLSSLLVIVTSCGGGGVDPAAAEQVLSLIHI